MLVKFRRKRPAALRIAFAAVVCRKAAGGFREALIKSAAVDGERFFVKTRLEKRGNTVCISRFSNRRIGGKDPSSAVGDLFRGSFDIAEIRRQILPTIKAARMPRM